jgi:hypothetical protein
MLDDLGQFQLVVGLSGEGSSVPAEELARQLDLLRTRAGSPSFRDIAKITELQAPGRGMSSSTVQEKISGKRAANLAQVMAIVRACAEHAGSQRLALPAADTDEKAWRERVEGASARSLPPSPAVAVDVTANGPAAWDLDPLYRADMHDMVDLVQASAGQPMAGWFLPLIEALALAGMSDHQFLATASAERASDLVESLTVLASHDREDALERLLNLSARKQPAESIPAILVFLRRRRDEYQLASRMLSILSGDEYKLVWWPRIRKDIASVVLALHRATLHADAGQLIGGIGKYGEPATIFLAAESLQDPMPGTREAMLYSVGTGDHWHLIRVLKLLRKGTIKGIDSNDAVDRIIHGIPLGKLGETASYLTEQGLQEEAQLCLELKSGPPF